MGIIRRPRLARPSSSGIHSKVSREVIGGREVEVVLDTKPEAVPGTLLLPPRFPSPVALLLHGAGSSNHRMSSSVGYALLRHGVASLAIDLPMHGAREGDVRDLSLKAPLDVVRAWKLAVAESREAVWLLGDDARFDTTRIGIVGYSLGAYLATIVAASEPGVKAVVLAAGGDLPADIPFATLVRTVADPLRAVRAIAGRPLLMINGRHDQRVTAQQGRALFEAAGEPKEMHWYNGGHWPPAPAIEKAAAWMAGMIGQAGGQETVA